MGRVIDNQKMVKNSEACNREELLPPFGMKGKEERVVTSPSDMVVRNGCLAGDKTLVGTKWPSLREFRN